MLLPIRIQHYQQAKNPVTLPGEDRWVDKWDVCITCNSAESAAGLKKALLQIDADVLMSRGTSPPQRTWVGLTDEEIQTVHDNVPDDYTEDSWVHSFARAIEAKLKERNT